jgi:hypothetical protein
MPVIRAIPQNGSPTNVRSFMHDERRTESQVPYDDPKNDGDNGIVLSSYASVKLEKNDLELF